MRKREWMGVFAAVALIGVSACGGDAGDDADTMDDAATVEPGTPAPAPTGVTLPEGVTQDMVAAGRAAFNGTTCWTCHGQDGAGGPLAPALNDATWLNVDGDYNNIREVIRTGVPQPKEHPGPMPERGGAQITDEQIDQIAAYIYSISRGG